jgi:hypothetical protein
VPVRPQELRCCQKQQAGEGQGGEGLQQLAASGVVAYHSTGINLRSNIETTRFDAKRQIFLAGSSTLLSRDRCHFSNKSCYHKSFKTSIEGIFRPLIFLFYLLDIPVKKALTKAHAQCIICNKSRGNATTNIVRTLHKQQEQTRKRTVAPYS